MININIQVLKKNIYLIVHENNGLKIPNEQSEDVNRRTDNAMAKIKQGQKTNSDPQNSTPKTED